MIRDIAGPRDRTIVASRISAAAARLPKAGVGIVNLVTGQATTVAEHVKSFRVPDDVTPQASRWAVTSCFAGLAI